MKNIFNLTEYLLLAMEKTLTCFQSTNEIEKLVFNEHLRH